MKGRLGQLLQLVNDRVVEVEHVHLKERLLIHLVRGFEVSEEAVDDAVREHAHARVGDCEVTEELRGVLDTEVAPAEALELIARGRFDLYLLDNWLPGGSGVELCREIRRSDPSTPIVFYSGAGLDFEREEALAAGAQAYLVKPGDARPSRNGQATPVVRHVCSLSLG